MSPTSYQTAPPRGGQRILARSGCDAADALRWGARAEWSHRFGTNSFQSWNVHVLNRFRPLPHHQGMATLEQKIAAERDALNMLEQNGLPEPDDVEYGHTCIRLIWWEPKAALIVQIDPPPPGHVFAEDLRDLDDLDNVDELEADNATAQPTAQAFPPPRAG